ncbi:MAG TPA: hypothetical protein VF246_04730 [Acidimicrobiia bacterium]
MRRRATFLVLAVLLVACDRGVAPPVPTQGADTPTAVVEALIEAFSTPDFESAVALAMPGQAALASLAEGASFGDVAEALRGDGAQVTANFWSGFAQGAGDYLTGELDIADQGTETVGEVVFHQVRLVLPDQTSRRIYAREADGYRIDLFASFGGGIAGRMIQPVERLLTTQTDDARLILSELRKIVPSLMVAASNTDLQPAVINDLARLIEVITRVS